MHGIKMAFTEQAEHCNVTQSGICKVQNRGESKEGFKREATVGRGIGEGTPVATDHRGETTRAQRQRPYRNT